MIYTISIQFENTNKEFQLLEAKTTAYQAQLMAEKIQKKSGFATIRIYRTRRVMEEGQLWLTLSRERKVQENINTRVKYI